jgi:hypothetical protein
MFSTKLDSGHQTTRTGDLSLLCNQDRFHPCFSLFLSCHLYHCLSLYYGGMLISELTVTHLNDIMVNTSHLRGDSEPDLPNGNPPPSPTLAQAIASILESRDEQTELLQQLVANSTPTHGDNGARNNHAQASTTYGEFTATHPPLLTKAGEPLDADNWLRVIESKFGLLHYTETLCRTAAVERCMHVVGQLHYHSPRELSSAMG